MTPYPHSLPRRVLMTTDTVGGVWTYSLDLCRGLVARGINVVLATMGAPVSPRQREQAEVIGARLHLCESTYKLEWMDNPWDDVAAAGEWLLSLEREFQPDLIHLNGYAHAALPWNAPTLVVAHSCVFSWWHAVKRCAPPAQWTAYHAAVGRGIRGADLVVAPSRAMLAQIARHYGLPANARVIYNGRDPLGPSATVEKKEPSILCVGRVWDEAKNATGLAAIAPRVSWPVRVAGDTRHPDGGEIYLPRVELLGVRTPAELHEDYSRASIYAMPARYEPFGLSVLEAAQAGCALVLGDIASLREIWGSTAIFVPSDDEEALFDAVADLIVNPAQREEMGAAARLRARSFTLRHMVEGYLRSYGELIANKRVAASASAPMRVERRPVEPSAQPAETPAYENTFA